jgi:hypothetical protein
MKTASTDGHGHRIMVSQSGNKKFPSHTPHPQCPDCAEEECKEALQQIAKAEETAFFGSETLAAKYRKLKDGSK